MILAMQLAGPVRVTPESLGKARDPQVAIDHDGAVYVAYGSGDTVYVSASTDRGTSYRSPVQVGQPGKLSLGMRRGPRIAAHRGVLTVTAIYGAQGKGRDGDIVAFRSADKGATWTGPVVVNDVEGSGREGLHAMAIRSDGTLACTWLDMRSKGTTLCLATSSDGGATWSPDTLVYTSPSGTVCECCHPSLAFDRSGKLHLMFRNWLEGARDMYLVETKDFKTFGPAKKLGSGSWMLNACPMDGGMLAVAQDGSVHTVWRRDTELFEATPNSSEKLLGQGRNPWIAYANAGKFLAWQKGNEVFFRSPGKAEVCVSEHGSEPVIAASPDGTLVIGCWNEGGIRSIRL